MIQKGRARILVQLAAKNFVGRTASQQYAPVPGICAAAVN
jgi:hypothetical protein